MVTLHASGHPMRAWVFLLALALVPSASAATAQLQLAAPPEAAASGSRVAIGVILEAEGFWCSQPREIVVEAMAWGTGAQATLHNATLRFAVDDEPHFAGAFRANGTIHVDVQALGPDGGTVEVAASASPPADCFSPDGWTTTRGHATVRVLPEPPAESAPQEPSAPAEDGAAANETGEDAPPATNETDADANGTRESVDDARRPPESGYIGDYRPPGETENVPSPGLLLALVALAAVALSRKR